MPFLVQSLYVFSAKHSTPHVPDAHQIRADRVIVASQEHAAQPCARSVHMGPHVSVAGGAASGFVGDDSSGNARRLSRCRPEEVSGGGVGQWSRRPVERPVD